MIEFVIGAWDWAYANHVVTAAATAVTLGGTYTVGFCRGVKGLERYAMEELKKQ